MLIAFTTIGIPTGLFLVNLGLRSFFRKQQSSAADLLLILLSFDLAALVSDELQRTLASSPHISTSYVPAALAASFLMMLLCWFLVVAQLEEALSRYHISREFPEGSTAYVYPNTFPFFRWALCWLIAGTTLIVHIGILIT